MSGLKTGDAVVVTGAAQGIGRAIAVELARRGAKLALWDVLGDGLAETEKLCAKLNAEAITRIVDVFPAHQQAQVRTQLSLVIEGIVCQALVPRVGGGRAAALEILVPTAAVRNLIREDKLHQVYSAMQVGQEKVGMQTANQALARLYMGGQSTSETALTASAGSRRASRNAA